MITLHTHPDNEIDSPFCRHLSPYTGNLLGVDEAMRGDGELLAVLKEAAEEDGKNGLSDDIRTILRATLQDVSTAPPK